MLVGWSLPTCGATSRSFRKRAAWKSSSVIPACRSEDCTHWPLPERSRSSSAVMMPRAASSPAPTSTTAAPTRTGPWPGKPVTDMSPLMPWAIWSKPGRSR